MKNSVLFWLFILLFIPAATNARQFILSSESFKDGSKIPSKYARNGIPIGKNISPQLTWKNKPDGTKSFALTCVDIAPVARNWIHWEVFNIPANINRIEEGASCKNMPLGSIETLNSFGNRGYAGPQPPENTGVHTYIFSIYALNVHKIAPEKEFYTYDEFLQFINGKIVEQTSITALFINESH